MDQVLENSKALERNWVKEGDDEKRKSLVERVISPIEFDDQMLAPKECTRCGSVKWESTAVVQGIDRQFNSFGKLLQVCQVCGLVYRFDWNEGEV